MIKLNYFTPDEFTCQGENVFDKMDEKLLKTIDAARTLAGVPFIIESSFRTKEYNDLIDPPAAKNSAHLRGKAVDITCDDNLTRYRMLTAFLSLNIVRIGIGSNFIHVDVDSDLPSPRIWNYK